MTTAMDYARDAVELLPRVLDVPADGFDKEAAAAVIERTVRKALRERSRKASRQVKDAEAAAQKRLMQLLSSSPAVIYSFKARGDFGPTFVSDNIEERLRLRAERISRKPGLLARPRPPRRPGAVEARSPACSRMASTQSSTASASKDGTYCWVNDELRLIRDEDGEPLEVVGSWSDITARKQLGERSSPRRIVSSACSRPRRRSSTASRRAGDFAPTFVSQNIKEWLGYEPQEYLESPDFWWRCVHPDDLAAVEAQSASLYRTGRHTIEYRFLKKDGTYCWVNDEQRLVRDKEGQPVEVVGSWSDITARKRAEEAAAAARERVEHLVACSPAVIYSFKATGDFAPTFISRNIKDLLGYEREEYLKSPDFWQQPASIPRTARAFRGLMRACSRRSVSAANTASARRTAAIAGSATSCRWCATRRAIRSRWSAPGATSPRASSLARRWSPRRTASSIFCRALPRSSTASRRPAISRRHSSARTSRDWLGYEPNEYLESPDFWWRCVHPDDSRRWRPSRSSCSRRAAIRSSTASARRTALLLGHRRAAPDPRQGRPAGRGGRLVERRDCAEGGGDRLPSAASSG